MFNGSAEDLKQTKVTQPAIFLHSVILAKILGDNFHTHNLRGIYAIYSYTFRNPDNIKINPFVKSALNHLSLDASLSYTGYKINFTNDIIN